MSRKLACCLLIALAICAAICRGADRPNVLLILTDDQGFGDLSSYGAKDLHTPNMDSIVARGMRFDNFYASCPVCSPSRAALLSGKYPDRVGIPGLVRTDPKDNWGYLARDAVLLPAVLDKAGYHTGMIGKWNLGLDSEHSPNAKGFEFYHGFLGDMMDDYWKHLRQGHNYMRLNGREVNPQGHATDIFTEWAIDYVKQRAAEARDGHPFFLYLAYNAPHVPIQPPPDWLEKVKKREPGIDERRAKMVALLEHLDDGIGKVLAILKDEQLDQNTLIIFTSDNGGQVNAGANVGPYRGTKATMYEGGLRVPLAVMWPGHISPASSSLAVCAHMDLMPTVCEAAGASPPSDIDALSLLSVLTGKAADLPHPRELYWVHREGGPQFLGLASHALRLGDWKLLQNRPFSPLELYNLKDDPGEEHDLAASRPRVRNELARALQLHIQQAGAIPWEPPANTPQAR